VRVIRSWLLAATCAVALLCGPAAAQVEPLRVYSSNGVKAALEALQPQSERLVGRPLSITFGTSASVRQRIAGGEPFDAAVLTTDVIDALTQEGKILRGSTAAMGRSGIGIGVRAGTMKLDVQTADALKHILQAAGSLTYAADGASRPAITRMFDTFGIAEAMKSKTILEQGSIRATARVVQGDADMVITLISEILPIAGLELAGPLPEEFQSYVSFAGGVGSGARNTEAAGAFIAFLAGPSARATFTARGIERSQ
jgi:molybdate transport system substrate-binding protein